MLPDSASANRVDDALRSDFPPFRDTPIQLATGGGRREAEEVARDAARLTGVAEVRPPIELAGGNYAVEAVSSNPPLSGASEDLVGDLRALEGDVLAAGVTADFVDLKESLADRVPVMLAIVVAVTLTVLFAFTGSVVLPVKQILMNLLGLSAVFGILVLIFQDGRLEGLLGYTSQGALEATQPLFLFVVAFGLSTDYGVFLLSRIKEAHDGGATDSDAVAIGLERVGRIATAAAVLFAVAIGVFVTSEMIFIKQLGLGIALAVLIDATIIRSLLVPSLMELLGKWNWWAPKPLRQLHARLGVSEAIAAAGVEQRHPLKENRNGKIVISENVSLDGVIEDLTGAEGLGLGGWFWETDRGEDGEFTLDKTLGTAALLLGRRSYEFFAATWPSAAASWRTG